MQWTTRARFKIRLAMSRDQESGFCVITIADKRPGINKAQLSKIFEPFYTTRKEGSAWGCISPSKFVRQTRLNLR